MNLGHFKIKSIAGIKNDSYVVVIIILWYQGLSEGSNIKADFLTREERLAMCQWKKSTINASIFTPKKIALFLNYCCEVVKRDFGRQLIKPVIDHFHQGGCKRGMPTRIGLSKEFVVQNMERFHWFGRMSEAGRTSELMAYLKDSIQSSTNLNASLSFCGCDYWLGFFRSARWNPTNDALLERRVFEVLLAGFCLGSSIEGKRKMLLRALSTPLMLFNRKSSLLKIFVFYKNCHQRFITNRCYRLKKRAFAG